MSFSDDLNKTVFSMRCRNDREHRVQIDVFRGKTGISVWGPAGKRFSHGFSTGTMRQAKAILLQFAEKGVAATRPAPFRRRDPETNKWVDIGTFIVGIDENGTPYMTVSCEHGQFQVGIYPPEPNLFDHEEATKLDTQRATIIAFFEDMIAKANNLEWATNVSNKAGQAGGGQKSGGFNRGNGGNYNRGNNFNRGGGQGGFNRNGGGYNRNNNGGGSYNNNHNGGGYNNGGNGNQGFNTSNAAPSSNDAGGNTGVEDLDDEISF